MAAPFSFIASEAMVAGCSSRGQHARPEYESKGSQGVLRRKVRKEIREMAMGVHRGRKGPQLKNWRN